MLWKAWMRKLSTMMLICVHFRHMQVDLATTSRGMNLGSSNVSLLTREALLKEADLTTAMDPKKQGPAHSARAEH